MYGKLKNTGIPSLRDYKAALEHWRDIKPIRGRDKDERPIGARRKNYMQIFQDAAGNMVCSLYKTNVVTFYPDNKVRLHVPEQWRTSTTASFIKDVLGGHRVYTGVYAHDVCLGIKGDDARQIRIGENTMLEVAHDGSFKLVSNDNVGVVLSVGRSKMNAVRKSVAPFMKFATGAIKLREAEFQTDFMTDMMSYLADNANVGIQSVERNWHERVKWTLVVPDQQRWWKRGDTEESRRLHTFFLDRVRNGDTGDWNHMLNWAAASFGHLRTGRFGDPSKYRMTVEVFNTGMSELLLAAHPEVFVQRNETREKVERNRYRKYMPFVELTNKEKSNDAN